MIKNLNIFEGIDLGEKVERKTVIEVRNPETGALIYRGSNMVIVSGALFTAAKHWNINMPVRTPSYNSILNLENIDTTLFNQPGLRREESTCLFAVGTDGCGPQQDQVYNVDFKKWIAPDALVPFRYPLKSEDLSDSLRNVYFGRKDDTVKNRFAYYFKAFEGAPVGFVRYMDGTPVDENIYTSSKPEKIEVIIEVNLKVTKEDCREWFKAMNKMNEARINTISLLTAWPKVINGKTFYQDIRPLTKFNMPTEALLDLSKGLDIKYQVYY